VVSTAVVERAGVDTVSHCWYAPEGTRAQIAIEALATLPGPARSRLMREKIDGYTIGWYPRSCLVFAEGHPGGDDGLGCPDELPSQLGYLEASMWDHGLPVHPRRTRDVWASSRPQTSDRSSGYAGVRRLDATADVAFGSGAEGLAVLAGVAALLDDDVLHRNGGLLATVLLKARGGRKTIGRLYDKSYEANSGPRGTLIRVEDQRRWASESRRGVEELTSGYVRDKHCQRFIPLWRATKGVTVAGPIVMAEKLVDAVEAGEITARQAKLYSGEMFLAAIADARGVSLGERTTRYRHRRAIRELGLVVADGALQEVEVDLHDVMDQVLDADVWGARG
jgi:hypothetical protein